MPLKKQKQVSFSQCIWTIIACLICLALMLFVPFAFGEKMIFTFSTLPLVGDGSIEFAFQFAMAGFFQLINFTGDIPTFLVENVAYVYYAFYIILAIDLLFAIILMIFKVKTVRIIFRIFSIAFAFCMLIIALCSLISIVGIIGHVIKGTIEFDFMALISNYGLTTYLLTTIIGIVLFFKQFGWFTAPFTLKFE